MKEFLLWCTRCFDECDNTEEPTISMIAYMLDKVGREGVGDRALLFFDRMREDREWDGVEEYGLFIGDKIQDTDSPFVMPDMGPRYFVAYMIRLMWQVRVGHYSWASSAAEVWFWFFEQFGGSEEDAAHDLLRILMPYRKMEIGTAAEEAALFQ